jgi:hypothetical protein
MSKEETSAASLAKMAAEQQNASGQQQQRPGDDAVLDPFTAHALLWAYFKMFQTPLDRMKVLLQASREVRACLTPYQKNLLTTPLDTARGVARHVWLTEGFRGLWRGALLGFGGSLLHTYGGVVMGSVVDWAARPEGKSHHTDRTQSEEARMAALRQSMARKGYYSVVGGLALSLVLYPLDLVRLVRMMDLKFPTAGRIDHEYPHIRSLIFPLQQGRFVFRCVPKPFLENAGPQAINALKYSTLWRGYFLSLGGMLTYRASHLFVGSLGLRVVDATSGADFSTVERAMTPAQELAFGFGVSMLANAAVYPLDVFRSRFIRAGFVSSPLPGGGDHLPMRALAGMIWRHEGVRGFYRGAAFALTVRAATLSLAAFAVPMAANSMSDAQPPQQR